MTRAFQYFFLVWLLLGLTTRWVGLTVLGAANRQDDRYPDPDRFDVFRPARAHIGFGHGVHVCLGMHLARLELRAGIGAILDRLPRLRLDPEAERQGSAVASNGEKAAE